MVHYLVDLLTQAKEAYYETGEAIMSDALYDRNEYYLKILDPDNDFLNKVGS